MNTGYFTTLKDTPVGILLLTANSKALTGLYFVGQDENYTQQKILGHTEKSDHVIFQQTKQQLHEYFAGKRKDFEIPLEFSGTTFQKSVWNALFSISFGQTASYLQIADQIGNPKAVRAVGLTNGKNPISIICPCHRVIGSNGKLTGYGGGLHNKKWLLQHEKANTISAQQRLF